jgi:hypothetical protein
VSVETVEVGREEMMAVAPDFREGELAGVDLRLIHVLAEVTGLTENDDLAAVSAVRAAAREDDGDGQEERSEHEPRGWAFSRRECCAEATVPLKRFHGLLSFPLGNRP